MLASRSSLLLVIISATRYSETHRRSLAGPAQLGQYKRRQRQRIVGAHKVQNERPQSSLRDAMLGFRKDGACRKPIVLPCLILAGRTQTSHRNGVRLIVGHTSLVREFNRKTGAIWAQGRRFCEVWVAVPTPSFTDGFI